MLGLAPLSQFSKAATNRSTTPVLFRDIHTDICPERRHKHPLAVPVEGITRNIQVKIASERCEWEEVFGLVAANYRARGYEAPESDNLRFTPFHALPDTAIFVAKENDHVIATLSLVADNCLLGLPLDTLFGSEVKDLRRAGRRLVEVTSLADQDLSLREFIPVFTALMRLMAQYGIHQGADTWVITINPRHRLFYRKVMGFVPLGPQREYSSVRNHPAEAYMLDPVLMQNNAPEMYQSFFNKSLPADALLPAPIPAHLIRYFSSRSSQTNEPEITGILQWVECFGSPRQWEK